MSVKKTINKDSGSFYITHAYLKWIPLLQIVLVGCVESVSENEKSNPNAIIQEADHNLLQVKGPTNWEYGGWQNENDSLLSYYAQNINIVTKPAESAGKLRRIFRLIAIKDTINRFYLATEEDFFKELSGNTIKIDFDFSGEKVYGFNYQKLEYSGDTLHVINIQPASSIFDKLNKTKDLILSVELKDFGTLEIVFATRGFFWSK